ncbi:Mini-chromosome maintenance complex-binding protein [Trypanosoma melophagium]|uniref:Mini-chromosome maintenance complex-binding protein n=1 Tax=Trypanosoma melophagium TaxID=715481 RepID=UPI00351A808C|nr:Mini-chromosome maintenance complex-binding protein [Trypanosoma melophagium]
MDRVGSETAMRELLREKSDEFGDVAAALRFVHELLPEILQRPPPDIFPTPTPTLNNTSNGSNNNTSGGSSSSSSNNNNGNITSTGFTGLRRCRGMLQEVEPAVSLYRASPTDFFGVQHTDDVTLLEATRYYVIPVPGNAHFYNQQDGEAEDRAATYQQQVEVEIASIDRKRRGRSPEGRLCDNPNQPLEKQDIPIERGTRIRREETSSHEGNEHNLEVGIPLYQQLNLPHPPLSTTLHTACIVTVIHHSGSEREQLKLNDVVDFFGFVEDNSNSFCMHSTTEMDEFENFGTWHAEVLPPALLSRMICMSWRHVYSTPERPIVPPYFENKRPFVVQYFSNTICQGDVLLAEYILLHLCARVITHESATPIGDVPLRVEGDSINPEQWSMWMRTVVPVGEVLLGEKQLLNSKIRIAPKQDHNANILRTGMLQLANGTHVTLDCHAISKATNAVHEGIFAVMHRQVLPLEYPYQTHDLPIDLNFLALSTNPAENDVGFLRLAVSVRWQPENLMDAATTSALKPDEVREYLGQVRCVCRRFDTGDVCNSRRLADRLVSFAEQEPRWNNRDSFIHNNSFSMAASLMRACAASFGRELINDKDVEHVLSLERRRVARTE